MDPVQNPTLSTVPQQPVAATPQVVSAPLPPKKSNKMLVVLMIIFVLLLAVLGAYYFMTQNNTTNDEPMNIEESILPTPTMTDEQEIESIEIEATDSSELEAIEKDIESL